MSGTTTSAIEPAFESGIESMAAQSAVASSLEHWVAMPTFTEVQLERALDELAQAFGQVWCERLERPAILPMVALVSSQLTVTFADGMTEHERTLIATPEGLAAVEQDLSRKFDMLYPWIDDHVERLLHCFVAESHLTIDGENSTIGCVVTLRDLPRIMRN